MMYVNTEPQTLALAAADVAGIGSTVSAANEAAAGLTTGVPAAAADEVSAATAMLFNVYAQEYRAVIAQAVTFHDEFARALAAAGNAYADTEAANEVAMSGVLGALTTSSGPLSAHPLTVSTVTGATRAVPATAASMMKSALADPDVTLVMGGSGTPIPSPSYVAYVVNTYVIPNFPGFTLGNAQSLFTPEGLYPDTAVKDLTIDISVARGVTILNNAILQQYHAGNPVVVVGDSQSAIISSLVMPQLVAEGVPSGDVNFVLLGDPMNPNGGLWERFAGLSFPSLGLTFYGATPANTGYQTRIYTIEYDGAADYPQYPIDVFSDLNALVGIVTVHGDYFGLNPQALPPGYSMVTLPTSPGYNGGTTYEMITIPDLPLLGPVRAIPYIGNPLADLLQPDLTYLVNWGYGNPNYGYSTGPANVATPFGFLPPLSATTALGPDLVSGTQQGIGAAYSAFHAEGPPSLPALSLPGASNVLAPGPLATPGALAALVSPASIDSFIEALQAANTNVTNAVTSALSTGYSVLLPTADIVTAGLITVPSYDVNLFLDGISQAINGQPVAGLVNAIGYPVAADVALVTLGAGLESLVLLSAAQSIAGDFASL
ncbi:MAG TPA: PE-PPE domain-containing protein [Mycobacterium sp.]|nr:PE-PPE domain-containing protein [Mycobacterium sp.]HUH71544.1 PE-PPE domain-containing protein [Mycobacterium sp.]